jgi:CBS domain-containing protein
MRAIRAHTDVSEFIVDSVNAITENVAPEVRDSMLEDAQTARSEVAPSTTPAPDLDEPLGPSALGMAALCGPAAGVPRRRVPILDEAATVTDAVRAMLREDCGCAVVSRSGRIVGMLTERDVVRRVVAGARDPRATRLDAVMTEEPGAIRAEASVAYVMGQMTLAGDQHVLLTDGTGRPVGVLGVEDLLAWTRDLFPSTRTAPSAR